MGALLAPDPMFRAYDNNNNPLAGGQLYTYQAGTTTPVATYTDSTALTPNPNPVLLNARGEAPVWLSPTQAYKLVLKDANGNTIWTVDQVTSPAPVAVGDMTDEKGSDSTPGFKAGTDFTPGTTASLTLSNNYGSASNLWVAFDAAEQGADSYSLSGTTLTFNAPIPTGTNKVYVKGGTVLTVGTPGIATITDASVAANAAIQSSKLSYLQGGSGSVARTIQNKLKEVVSVLDFGADPTGATDSAPAFRLALAAVAYGGLIVIPTGRYLLNSAVNNAILDFTSFSNKGVNIWGQGWTLKTGGSFSFGSGQGPQGSILQIGSSIASNVDFFHQAPTDLVIGGVSWKDFAIVASTGAYGVAHGQNGFNIDGSANANGYIENLVMDNVFIDNFASGSSIIVYGVGNAQGVLAGAEFRNSKFMNFYAPGFGDSNTIRNNVIGANAGTTGAVGINFYNVSGATNTRILNNDMVNFNGMILCNGATKLIIDGNEFEQSTGSANSLGAMISLNGANGPVDTTTITNNSISQNSTVANYPHLVIGNANGTRIASNRLASIASYNPIQINSNSSYTLVEADNQSWVNGVVQDGVGVSDSGVKSMLRASPWSTYTPIVSAGTGSFTSVTALGAFQLVDTRTLNIRLDITINTVGTASGTVNVTIPSGLVAGANCSMSGKEIAGTGDGLAAFIAATSSTIQISSAAGASIIATGYHLILSGTIEIQ